MNNVRIFFERLGTGTIFVLICFAGMIPIGLNSIGISFFLFNTDPNFQRDLVVCFMFSLWGIAGLMLLIRREEGALGTAISIFAVIWMILNFSLALLPIYGPLIHK
jgi:hypothetical protein